MNEERLELRKVRSRNYQTTSLATHQEDNITYLERDIQTSDNLASISLLYGCSVNELKRVNNLISEQDLYALKKVKIPVKKFGILTDSREEITKRLANRPSDLNSPSTSDLSDSISEETDSLLHPEDEVRNYLKTVDKQIRSSMKTAKKPQVLDEVVSSLGSVGYQPLTSPGIRRQAQDECNGSDWGCKWWAVLLCFLFVLLFFILIIAYEFYWHKKLTYIDKTIT